MPSVSHQSAQRTSQIIVQHNPSEDEQMLNRAPQNFLVFSISVTLFKLMFLFSVKDVDNKKQTFTNFQNQSSACSSFNYSS